MVEQYLQDALNNRLLAALPSEDFARIRTGLERVMLSLGQVIYEPEEKIDYVYFPVNSIISMLYTTCEGATTEIGIHGNDGVVGFPIFMGGSSTQHQIVVISAGFAYRMKSQAVQNEFARGGAFQLLLLKFALSLITQISQTAICSRLHSVEQNLCRWLLHSDDRMQPNNLIMTQELMARMIGVRREGVSLAAKKLQDENVIAYARGKISIIDRSRLEARACECYTITRQTYEDLIGR